MPTEQSVAEARRPRRVLALDGGGIRGVLTLGVLECLESHLRERAGDPNRLLAQEFDLIAGTSTGAIIACSLSWGLSVADVLGMYRDYGKQMFTRSGWLSRHRARYRADPIAGMFRQLFIEKGGEPATLRTDRLRTLLLVVVRNASTGSAWPVTNNPRALFNQPGPECNLDIPLWRLLRASTAAPTYFAPERIDVGRESFVFVDGGVTAYNNPALIALLTATLPPYRIEWPRGADRLALLSVGTGRGRVRLGAKPVRRLNLLDHLRHVPPALIQSIGDQQDAACRVLCRCVHGEEIDREVGDLHGLELLDDENVFARYARLNAPLDAAVPMDDVKRIDELAEIGRRYAKTLDLNVII